MANVALALIVVACIGAACWMVLTGHPWWAAGFLGFALFWRVSTVRS